MKRVFVSYPRTEQKFAEELRNLLRSWNCETWLDIDNIPIGAYWPDEIDNGLRGCDVVLGVISPMAVESRKVKNEWDWALIHHKRLILLRYVQCYIPLNYISINYIDFTKDPQQGFEHLRITLEAAPLQDQAKPAVLPKGEESARIQMLDQVYKHWIEGVLEGAVAMGELQLAVASQPHAVLRHTDYDDYLLQPGISIQEVFDKVGGELLILGYPGSGKTVTLLQLARDLIKRAREDNTRPIPLILNLSTWTPTITVVENNKPKELPISFDEWLVENISTIYDKVSPEAAREWLDKQHFVLLLDGLDEVAASKRDDCIEAINTFRKKPRYEAVSIVICSRVEEYQKLSAKVYLQAAVALQPLTADQIDTYLRREEFTELRKRLSADEVIREMARNAFLLNIMMRVFQGVLPGEILFEGPPEERMRQLFGQYIEARFREKHKVRYRSAESLRYLSWLGRKMKELSITLFDVTAINHLWLPENKRDTYWTVAIGSGAVAGTATGIVMAAIIRNACGVLMGQVAKLAGRYVGSMYVMRELRLSGDIPAEYEHFLNSMTEIDLMRKAGKRYMFIHRILLEYFAELCTDA